MSAEPVKIDGSMGEGGGQVLRTSLSLSLVTGRPLHIFNIRSGRPKPGLGNQHLTAVKAAAEVGRAEVKGAEIGSKELFFKPREVSAGSWRFSVGTAGSCTLVLQTVLPALLQVPGKSQLALEGGTHNPLAPPFEFLREAFIPVLERMGPSVEVKLLRPGFYPRGGGKMSVEITPCDKLMPVEVLERGELCEIEVCALVSHLPRSIAERELRAVREALEKANLGKAKLTLHIQEAKNSIGPGNALIIKAKSENLTEVFTSFGRKGLPAEKVASQVTEEALRYLRSEAALGEHLADQILLPLALAGGGKYRTLRPSSHTLTNAEVIMKFCPVEIRFRELGKDLWEVVLNRS